MKLFSDHDPRFRLLALKVALFLMATFIGGLLLMGGLGMTRGLFTKKTAFSFVAANALDIKPGMAVMLSGFKIGVVDDLTLLPDANVQVDIRIEDRYMQWMRVGTLVEVRKQGFIGEAYVDVRPGSSRELLPQDGRGLVAYKASKGLEEIAADLEARLMPVVEDMHVVVKDLHQLGLWLNDDKGDVRRTLANLKDTTAGASRAVSSLDRTLLQAQGVMGGVQHTLNSRVDPLLLQAETTLKATQATADSANAKIGAVNVEALQSQASEVLGRLNRSLDDVNAMTGKLREPVGNLAPRLPALVDDAQALVREGTTTLRNGDAAVQDVQIIVDRARHNWPLNLWAPPPAPALIPWDSHD